MSNLKLKSDEERPCINPEGSPLILGAGGWNIFHHLGVLHSLQDHEFNFGKVLGVSAGSLAAAMFTNGYTPKEMTEILLKLADERDNPFTLVEAVTPADPVALAIGGMFSLKPMFSRLVEEYGLKPNNQLKIVACDVFTHEPVIFEGTDYDLASALAASGSVPGVYQPVWHYEDGRPKLLVDGAIYHYSPTEFTSGAAVVSKFRPAKALPQEWRTPLDLYFHFRELCFPLAGNHRYVDEDKHLVIETGLAHVAALNNGLSKETMLHMVENGRDTAHAILTAAKEAGRLCPAR